MAGINGLTLLPCPFCGTDPNGPVTTVETGETMQIECSGCGALWPAVRKSEMVDATGEEITALFNRRAA